MEIFKGFLSVTFFVTLMTCLFYVAGSTYTIGYLSTFGIEDRIFRHDFSYTIEKGGLVFFLGWIKLSILGVVYSFTALVYTYLAHEIAKEEWLQKLFGKLQSNFLKRKKIDQKEAPVLVKKILNISAFAFLTWVLLAVTAFAYYCLITFALEQGKAQAGFRLKEISSGDIDSDHYLTLSIGDAEKVGALIAADGNFLALYMPIKDDPKKAKLEIVPHALVTKISKVVGVR